MRAVAYQSLAGWLDHVERVAFKRVPVGHYNSSAEGAVQAVLSVHVHEVADLVGEHVAWNRKPEVVGIAFGLAARAVDNMPRIGHPAAPGHSILRRDGVDSVVAVGDHHILLDELISAEQDSILAADSDRRAG